MVTTSFPDKYALQIIAAITNKKAIRKEYGVYIHVLKVDVYF